jgi:protocatechuate 3,4-dioxygenase beta subunit
MEGRVLDGRKAKPVRGLMLYVYHADRNGRYALDDGPHAHPRLAGLLRTDERGRYRVLSVLPGQYAGAPHIHFEAWGPQLPLSTWAVNLYMGPRQSADSTWGRMAVLRRLALDPDRRETFVTRDAHGVFHARYDLRLDQAFRAPAHLDSLRRGLAGE